MTLYYNDGQVTIYHGDAYDIVDSLEFAAVVSDPPYGINWKPRVTHQDQTWQDRTTVDLKPFLRGQHHLFWGGNYFADQLPTSESWFVWVKRPDTFDVENDRRSYSVCEMAWSDFGGKPRMRYHVWDGGMRQGDSSNRQFLHPAQKPLEIMRWCLAALPEIDGPVLDPFMGSGTTLVAAVEAGHRAIGIEREEEYCEIAVQRLAQGVLEFR